MAKLDLWKTSGHFDFYKENMFDRMEIEEEEYQLKPMNCPFHIEVYRDGFFSYKDLPIRCAALWHACVFLSCFAFFPATTARRFWPVSPTSFSVRCAAVGTLRCPI